MRTCISGTAGGGVCGKDVGTVHVIMIAIGVITMMSPIFILMSSRVGEDITETIIGMDITGTMNGFLTDGCNGIGRAGIMMDFGKGKETGVSGTINRDQRNRDRS